MKKINTDTVKTVLEVVSSICDIIVKVMNGKSEDSDGQGKGNSKSQGKEAA